MSNGVAENLFWGLARCRIGCALAVTLSCQDHMPSAETDHKDEHRHIVSRRAVPPQGQDRASRNSPMYTTVALLGDALEGR